MNPVSADGRVGDPMQVIPTARNAHAIITDRTNRYVFVPHLGTDQMFQFVFDPKNGRLTANTPPVLQLKQGTGPRHLIASPDNRYVYLLNELTATVSTLALDLKTGTLTEMSTASALAPDSKLGPGHAAPAARARREQRHLGLRHPHHAERPLPLRRRAHLELDRRLQRRCRERQAHLLASTPTEKQPRGFRIDPTGRFMVVSGEKSETLSTYAIDASSGALRPIGKYPTGKGSNWVEIVSFD